MDKKLLIDSYLEGKHPIEQEKWELPTESELDRDEALYDALLAERLSKSPLKGDFTSPLRGGRVGSWRGRRRLFGSIAAVLIAAVALFTWWNFKPLQPTQLAETTTKPLVKEVPQSEPPTAQPALNNQITQNNQISQSPQKTPITQKTPNTPSNQKTPTTPKAPTPQASSAHEPVLASAADSLYYYLTLLENQMGDCRDSTCLAELTGLMRADERIKDLVNKIIHKQVETAYKEEYLVDTTTRYIPL